MPDHPFDEVIESVRRLASAGHSCFQKFTCRSCGKRLVIDVPNEFWHEGTCENPECANIVTDIKAQGCNYLFISNTHALLGTPLTVTVHVAHARPARPS